MGAESNVGHRPLGRWGSALLLREQSWEARFHNYEHLPFPGSILLALARALTRIAGGKPSKNGSTNEIRHPISKI